MPHLRLAAVFAVLLASLPARATTIQVTTATDELNADGDCSLREAVEAANRNVAVDACPAGVASVAGVASSMDAVLFGALAGQTLMLTLGGPDARVTVDAGGAGRAFRIDVPGVRRRVTLLNLAIRNGRSASGGAVLVADGEETAFTDVRFENNVSMGSGGALRLGVGEYMLTGCTFIGNRSEATGADEGGGAVYVTGSTLTVSGGLMRENTAAGSGGIWRSAEGSLTARATGFTTNTASGVGGGAVFNEGEGRPLVLTGVTLLRNAATGAAGAGGGVYNGVGGTVALTGATVQENTAGAAGGGLWSPPTGTLTVETTSFVGNAAPRGGGVFKAGEGGAVKISRSLFRENRAPTAGDGLYTAGGFVTVRNSTLSGNTGGDGAGAFVAAGRLSLLSATVARNVATGTGGGVRAAGGTLVLGNTVVGDNRVPGDSTAAGSDCAGLVTGSGVYLMEVTAGCSFTVRSPVQADARLRPLAGNGGPTLTHALAAGSPAERSGQTTETVDQRGYARTATPSIGAFEVGGLLPTVATDAARDAAAPLTLSPARPNPVHGRSSVTVTAAQSGPALVELIDALGRRVRTLFDGPVADGVPVQVEIDASGLAPGVYVVRFTASGATSAQRVTVVR